MLVLKIVSYGCHPTIIKDTTCKDNTELIKSWVIPTDCVIAAGGSVIGAVYNLNDDSKIN